jgi:hypothetical protein
MPATPIAASTRYARFGVTKVVFAPAVANILSPTRGSITMYASVNSVDVRALLPRGTTGFLIWFDEGDVAGRKGDCYAITVGSIGKDRDLEVASRIIVSVAITRTPTENFTIPA